MTVGQQIARPCDKPTPGTMRENTHRLIDIRNLRKPIIPKLVLNLIQVRPINEAPIQKRLEAVQYVVVREHRYIRKLIHERTWEPWGV
jgi:hypothetical protein